MEDLNIQPQQPTEENPPQPAMESIPENPVEPLLTVEEAPQEQVVEMAQETPQETPQETQEPAQVIQETPQEIPEPAQIDQETPQATPQATPEPAQIIQETPQQFEEELLPSIKQSLTGEIPQASAFQPENSQEMQSLVEQPAGTQAEAQIPEGKMETTLNGTQEMVVPELAQGQSLETKKSKIPTAIIGLLLVVLVGGGAGATLYFGGFLTSPDIGTEDESKFSTELDPLKFAASPEVCPTDTYFKVDSNPVELVFMSKAYAQEPILIEEESPIAEEESPVAEKESPIAEEESPVAEITSEGESVELKTETPPETLEEKPIPTLYKEEAGPTDEIPPFDKSKCVDIPKSDCEMVAGLLNDTTGKYYLGVETIEHLQQWNAECQNPKESVITEETATPEIQSEETQKKNEESCKEAISAIEIAEPEEKSLRLQEAKKLGCEIPEVSQCDTYEMGMVSTQQSGDGAGFVRYGLNWLGNDKCYPNGIDRCNKILAESFIYYFGNISSPVHLYDEEIQTLKSEYYGNPECNLNQKARCEEIGKKLGIPVGASYENLISVIKEEESKVSIEEDTIEKEDDIFFGGNEIRQLVRGIINPGSVFNDDNEYFETYCIGDLKITNENETKEITEATGASGIFNANLGDLNFGGQTKEIEKDTQIMKTPEPAMEEPNAEPLMEESNPEPAVAQPVLKETINSENTKPVEPSKPNAVIMPKNTTKEENVIMTLDFVP